MYSFSLHPGHTPLTIEPARSAPTAGPSFAGFRVAVLDCHCFSNGLLLAEKLVNREVERVDQASGILQCVRALSLLDLSDLLFEGFFLSKEFLKGRHHSLVVNLERVTPF